MQIRLPALLLTFVVIGLRLLVPDPTHAQKQSASWTTIETFEGKDRAQTKPFTVQASKWRIKWKSTSKIPGGMGHVVQIYVLHPKSDKPRRVAANATNQKTLSGTSKTFSGGRYALKIHGLNGDWTVKVQRPK